VRVQLRHSKDCEISPCTCGVDRELTPAERATFAAMAEEWADTFAVDVFAVLFCNCDVEEDTTKCPVHGGN